MAQHATYSHAATLYRATAATTSPLAGIVMLYDGVIRELSRTIAAIEQKRLDAAFSHVELATTILRGLCHNLDFERGGPFAERMRDTYVRLIMSTLHSLGKPDAIVRFNKLIGAVAKLRDAWADVRIQHAKAAAERS
jgi:flagellar secretion chaperone FliS